MGRRHEGRGAGGCAAHRAGGGPRHRQGAAQRRLHAAQERCANNVRLPAVAQEPMPGVANACMAPGFQGLLCGPVSSSDAFDRHEQRMQLWRCAARAASPAAASLAVPCRPLADSRAIWWPGVAQCKTEVRIYTDLTGNKTVVRQCGGPSSAQRHQGPCVAGLRLLRWRLGRAWATRAGSTCGVGL